MIGDAQTPAGVFAAAQHGCSRLLPYEPVFTVLLEVAGPATAAVQVGSHPGD